MAQSGADKPTGAPSGNFPAKLFLALVGVIVLIVAALAVAFVTSQVNLLFWIGVAAIAAAVIACMRLFRQAREQLREMLAASKAFALSLIALLVLGIIIYAAAKLML